MISQQRSRHLIDLLLVVLLLLLMPYQLLDTTLHEWLGLGMLLLTFLHLLVNRSWWKHLRTGTYSMVRMLNILLNLALTLCTLTSILSGLYMSSHLFFDLTFSNTGYARGIHLVATHWFFLLMGLHLGMHWRMIIKQLKKRMHAPWYTLLYLMMVTVAFHGAYQLFHRDIIGYLFFTARYAYFDSQEPLSLFLLHYLAMFTGAIMLGHHVQRCLIKAFMHQNQRKQTNLKRD